MRNPSLFMVAVLPLVAASGQSPVVRVDPRIELTTVVFRLIRANEYNQCRVPSYAADIDRYFASYKEHPALKLAARIREEHGVGFDGVPSLAIALTDPPALAERLGIGADGSGMNDERWAGPHTQMFITALRSFARDTRFSGFFDAHRALYDSSEHRLRRFIASEVQLPVIGAYFGEPPKARFFAVPGMCNGGANYGPRVRPRTGPEERFAILGMSQVDAAGLPVMNLSDLPTVIHEFNHSYVNPLVERHRQLFEPAGARLLADTMVRRMMARQAYSEWETVVKESLVRASVIRYLRATRPDSVATLELQDQYANGFLWMSQLDSALARYEQSRATNRRLGDYMPQLAPVFTNAADSMPALVARFEAGRPRIVETVPRDGDGAVEAADTILTVRFDRVMRRGYSLGPGAPGAPAYPKVLSVTWDSTGTQASIRVQLQPATSFELLLRGSGFRTADGVPLRDWPIRFRTR